LALTEEVRPTTAGPEAADEPGQEGEHVPPAEQLLERHAQARGDPACDTSSEPRGDQAAVGPDRGRRLGVACAHEGVSGSVETPAPSRSKALGTGKYVWRKRTTAWVPPPATAWS